MKHFDPEVLARLKFAKLSDPTADASLMPTFFLAGPQRTGSTWLYHQLKRHPQVFLTAVKELYFLNTLKKPDHPQHITDDLAWYLQHFQESPEVRAARNQQCLADFDCAYDPKVRGEATASYAADLDEARLSDVVALIPNLKVIVVARNPVERAWSHAKLDLARRRGRCVADIPAREFDEYFAQEWIRRCGMYRDLSDRWTRALRPGHFRLELFDHIVQRPRDLVRGLLRFLDIDDDDRYLSAGDTGKNESEVTEAVPEPWKSRLVSIYRDELAYFDATYGVTWSRSLGI